MSLFGLSSFRRPAAFGRFDWSSLGRRLVQFWIVWSGLLLIHEGGHALAARHQGLEVRQITVGVGPALWSRVHDETRLVLRALPVAGLTKVERSGGGSDGAAGSGWSSHATTLSGGTLATLALVVLVSGVVAVSERTTRRRCLWGRIVIADALVLSVFNFLPVPPLDGGRAMLSAITALRGAPLSSDALFWVQAGGLALAVVPMTLWTKWTYRIDSMALRWRAPVATSRRP